MRTATELTMGFERYPTHTTTETIINGEVVAFSIEPFELTTIEDVLDGG